jgi:hypothetical protein
MVYVAVEQADELPEKNKEVKNACQTKPEIRTFTDIEKF